MIPFSSSRISRLAGGSILPYRFVVGGSTAHLYQASDATKPLLGTSINTVTRPNTPTDWKGIGELAEVALGGNANPGDLLTSDSQGRGIVTTTNGNEVGAICLEAGGVNQIVTVILVSRKV